MAFLQINRKPMLDKKQISQRLAKLGFNPAVLQNYEEPHRYYHNTDHLLEVLNILKENRSLDDELFLTAVYHDSIYDPRANDNEERSAELFLKDARKSTLKKEQKKNIRTNILDTKDHKASSPRSQKFIDADLNILNQPLGKQIEHEKKIFKEFQFVSYNIYKPERIKILQKINKEKKLDGLIDYVKVRKPLIGVFCGSFNPFHKGHYNVLQKAERIFDKVIIAFGKNPEKDDRDWTVPDTIKTRQIEEYDGLLTDFISSLKHDVTVIRGLRNSTDFQYEQNQYRYIQELMPDIKIINIFCDKEFEHISSSGIRTLERYNKHTNYLLD
jgi:pantetheine-phosphate adenylyltransferase